MSEDLQRRVGVWRALGDFKLSEAVWPEGALALVLGVGGAIVVIANTTPAERSTAVGSVIVLGGAFLAVVFAALAIVVAIPSDSYLRTLDQTPGGGVRRFLDPFLIAVGTQITLILLAVGYQLLASHVDKRIEHVAFGAVGFLFVFGVLDLAALARALVRHGIMRAANTRLDDDATQSGSVRQLPDRRSS